MLLLWMVTANKKYCSIQKSVFWLFYRFLNHNSRTSFSPGMRSLQKLRKPVGRLYSSKKVHMNELDFCQNPQNLIFERFLGLFGPSGLYETFFKNGLSHFCYFGLSNFIQKISKNWRVISEILRCKRMNGQSQIHLILPIMRVSNKQVN